MASVNEAAVEKMVDLTDSLIDSLLSPLNEAERLEVLERVSIKIAEKEADLRPRVKRPWCKECERNPVEKEGMVCAACEWDREQ